MTRRSRDRYADVGAAMRATIAAASRAALGERDYRVLGAVLWLTASYSKLSDQTSTRQIASIAYGVAFDEVHPEVRHRVAKTLRKLRKLEVIEYEASTGPGARCRVGLQRGVVTTPDSPEDEDAKRGRDDDKEGSSRRQRGVAGVAPPRSNSEKCLPSSRDEVVDQFESDFLTEEQPPEVIRDRTQRPEVVDALTLLRTEAPEALAGKGAPSVLTDLFRQLPDPVDAAAYVTATLRNRDDVANPSGLAIRLLRNRVDGRAPAFPQPTRTYL